MKIKDKLIIQDNILIAEFMGYKKELFYLCNPDEYKNKWGDKDFGFYDLPFSGGIPLASREKIWFPQTELKFHSDWNWLMYAWFKFQQKINEMSSEDGRYKSYLSHTQTTFCIGICEDENILSCHQTLIEGINWYNKKTF